VKSFSTPACVIVKHANPCGVAIGAHALEAYSKAFQTDPTSAFGGIIALNCELDEAAAQQISKQFVEVLMAPSFTAGALEVFKSKVNVRILQIDLPKGGSTAWDQGRNAMDMKRIGSGILLQTADNHELTLADLKVVTIKQPTQRELNDLLFRISSTSEVEFLIQEISGVVKPTFQRRSRISSGKRPFSASRMIHLFQPLRIL
jgi:phosphoribosylaminoimidazolecarboxamide formyltransferase/IMP cyclohydrolase